MANRLTEKRIRDVRYDPAKSSFVWDAGRPGFGVRLSKTGVRSFVLWTRVGGKPRLLTLGRWPVLSLDRARTAAAHELDVIDAGKDDLLTRRAARRETMTMAAGCAWYLETHIPRRQGLGKMAPRTATEYRRQIARYVLPGIGHLKIAAVERKDIETLLDKIGWDKPAQFSRVRALIRAMFNIFMTEGWRVEGANPAARIATPTERPSQRVLTDGEQAGILAALARLGDDAPGRALVLLFETGARLNEIRLLEWKHVDVDASELHLPATKTGPQTRVLTDKARAVIASCPEISGNRFVFSSRAGSPIGERTIRSRFHKAAQLAGIEGIRPHDFRRTMIVDALEAGIPITLVARMAGHSTIAMTSRYAAHETSQVKAAAEQLAAARKAKRGADVHALQFGRARS